MGLMYIFPTEIEESDRTEIINNKIILKTYGLPMIFWSYLAACLVVIGAMWLTSRSTIHKLVAYEDLSLHLLGLIVQYTLILTPLILLAFFFYEKQIIKSGKDLKLVYRIFFIPIYYKKITLDSHNSLTVDHFMDSPNMAKIYNKEELKGFENKGYFELHALSGDKNFLIDRHGRKADLIKMKELLSNY